MELHEEELLCLAHDGLKCKGKLISAISKDNGTTEVYVERWSRNEKIYAVVWVDGMLSTIEEE